MILVLNWKMNPEKLTDAEAILNSLKNLLKIRNFKLKINLWIAPPSLYFYPLKEKFGDFFDFGLQNVFYENQGAFTGEISPTMAKNLGVKFVILGHSERKKFGENLEMINKKALSALEEKFKVVLCFEEALASFSRALVEGGFGLVSAKGGAKPLRQETPARRWSETRVSAGGKLDSALTKQWEKQLKILLKNIPENTKKLYLAYEPSWAISSQGIGAAPKEYLEFFIKWYKNHYKFPVFYGGSVSNENIKDYLNIGFDGFLLGTASLNLEALEKIIKIIDNS